MQNKLTPAQLQQVIAELRSGGDTRSEFEIVEDVMRIMRARDDSAVIDRVLADGGAA